MLGANPGLSKVRAAAALGVGQTTVAFTQAWDLAQARVCAPPLRGAHNGRPTQDDELLQREAGERAAAVADLYERGRHGGAS
jgi:hypothetical protein